MVCDVHTYLVWKLAGIFKTSRASADPFGLFDLRTKKWSPVILDALKLHARQLPEVYQPGTVLGNISLDVSRSTGLNTRTLVVAGGGDGQAAGLGSNVLTPKRAYLNLGTAVVAGIYGSKYKTSKAFRTMSSCSETGYYYESSLRAGTLAIDWLIKNVLKIDPLGNREIYRQLEQQAQQIPFGSDGLYHLPYLCGAMNPYWDVDARGAFVGLSASHHRGHMYRSILEGIAFEELLAIESIEEATGSRVNELVAIGGGATNKLWCQIFADVLGRNICIPETTEASALGAAIAAAVGVGLHTSFSEAARRMSRTKEIIKPDLRHRKKLDQLFASYKALYPSLRKHQAESPL